MRLAANCLIGISLLLTVPGCGGDDYYSDDEESAEIEDVSLSSNQVFVGQTVRIEVEFYPATYYSASLDPLDDSNGYSSDDFELAVRIPVGLDYVENSSELEDDFYSDVVFGDADSRGPNRIELCEDGSRVLLYSFSDDELGDEEYRESELRFEAIAYEAAEVGLVSAYTDESIPFPCFAGIEEAEPIAILSLGQNVRE